MGVLGTYVLEVDWDNDGDFLDADEVLTGAGRVEFIRTSTGRSFPSQLTGKAVAGSLAAGLNNRDSIFSRFKSSSPIFGDLLPGRKVRLRTTAPSAAVLWCGYLEVLDAHEAARWVRAADLRAVGGLAKLTVDQVRIGMKANRRTDLAIGDVLDGAGWPAGDRALDAGLTTLTRWWAEEEPLHAIREIEDAEGGFFYERQTDFALVFEHRQRRLDATHQTSQATFTDAVGGVLRYTHLRQPNPLEYVYNEHRTMVTLYTVGAVAVLWTHPEANTSGPAPVLQPGEVKTFWGSYPNPDSPTDALAVDAWTLPLVATTDYLGNAAADGTGADLTGSLGVVGTGFGKSVKVEVTNNHATLPVYLTKLTPRGTPVSASDGVSVEASDSASITKYGRRVFADEAGKFVGDTEEGESRVKHRLSIWKEPLPVLEMSFSANASAENMTQALTRRVSDRVTVVSSYLGLSRDFFIEAVRHSIGADRRHEVTFDLSDAEAVSDFFVWGYSKWGLNTRLPY